MVEWRPVELREAVAPLRYTSVTPPRRLGDPCVTHAGG